MEPPKPIEELDDIKVDMSLHDAKEWLETNLIPPYWVEEVDARSNIHSKCWFIILSRGQPKAEVFWPLASVAEGFRPKILAEGLGHIFGKIFRCDRQSVLITISFCNFLFQVQKQIS